jgi:hypothetical protein
MFIFTSATFGVGLQIDLNLGSSGVVRGIMGLVFGYISALVVDFAFFIRVCLRTCSLHRLFVISMGSIFVPLARMDHEGLFLTEAS